MENVLYFAMTGAELQNSAPFPHPIAWMACHFSPYGTGICDLPPELPPGSMLILNDRIPIFHHDPTYIREQIAEIMAHRQCAALLLDFQRPGAEAVAEALSALPYPVAAPPSYAAKCACAVFLPSPPLIVPTEKYLRPWKERQIWMELATEPCCFRVSETGSRQVLAPPVPCPHDEPILHCRYGMDIREQYVDFHLRRELVHLRAMMEEAQELGVERFVGLYQQLSSFFAQAEAQDTARFQS